MTHNSHSESRVNKNRFCAIRHSFPIMLQLTSQWNKMYQSYADVAQDAKHFGRVGINQDAISRWVRSFDEKTGRVKEGVINNITDENLLWLCHRWGLTVQVKVSVNAKIPSFEGLIKNADNFDLHNIYK